MENEFTDKMKERSTEELIKIIELKSEYQPEAVAAAETELKKRDKEPKIWYYSKSFPVKIGPYTASEIKTLVQQGTILYNDWIYHEGMDTWKNANEVSGLFTISIGSTTPHINSATNTIENKKERPVGVIVAAIVTFICVPVWIIIALAQAGVSALGGNSQMGFLAIWNFFCTIVFIAIGIGLLRLKKWSYNWGLGTAIINVVWFGYNYSKTNLQIFLFLCVLELIIGVLLLSNTRAFRKEIKKTKDLTI